MFVTLVAVVLALVLGHVAPAQLVALRRYGWFDRWLQWLDAQAGERGFWHGRYGIVLALVPLLLVALVQWGLHAPWMGLPGFLFSLAVLVYAWGPRDLDVDVEAVMDAQDSATRDEAVARLWSSEDAPRSDDGPALVEAVFVGALRRWFGVLFWFVLLGPFGALLFRLAALACSGEFASRLPPATAGGARGLRALLEWPVAQLMTGSMALVGNFDAVWQAWRNAHGAELRLDTGFLGAAARASVKSELAEEAADYIADGLVPQLREMPELRDAMSLVWRILLLWLAVLAVFVIAGWVG